ncbi:MAG TPA: threonine synthase [Firmicutes bacterium]|nr:threonine synthase [Bacillota bacterium]
MRYISTRGQSRPVTAAEALLTGLAPDGGLYLPEEFPESAALNPFTAPGLTYRQLAGRILTMFLSDYTRAELEECISQAYGSNFATPAITPVTMVDEKLGFLELWHGPTCAFKDLALQLLPHLLTAAARKMQFDREIVLLVATSGDTGKAALEGFKDVPGTRVIVFYPEDGVSTVQKRQMITQEGTNTYVVGVTGNFDQAQAGVKALFTNEAFQRELAAAGKTFSSANSINWGRLVPQLVYYFKAWFDLCQNHGLAPGETFNVVVPTGNFGNILAAYYGKKLGLPLHKLICASNRNNVLTEFIQTGVYNRNRQFYQTLSPSMDILVSSNLERLLYDLVGADPAPVRAYMDQLQRQGSYQLTAAQKERLQKEFWAGFADEAETTAAIKSVYERYQYLLDPHTAVGYKVYRDYLEATGDDRPTIIASTASPFKFNQGVAQAVLGPEAAAVADEFALMEKLSAVTGVAMPAVLAGLRDKPIRHQQVIAPAAMEETVRTILGL